MLSLGKTENPEHRKGWDAIKVEQKDLPSEKLLNLNLPHHNKYLPER